MALLESMLGTGSALPAAVAQTRLELFSSKVIAKSPCYPFWDTLNAFCKSCKRVSPRVSKEIKKGH
jgi:hypothetical protein